MKLGFIGFGGAGYGLAKGLRGAGLKEVHFYDRMQETPPYAEVIHRHADEIGAIQAATLGELLSRVRHGHLLCYRRAWPSPLPRDASPFLGPGPPLCRCQHGFAARSRRQWPGSWKKPGPPLSMPR